ncbi:MAG: OprD family outer membrane porin [Endozoicomonas sp.]
MKLAITGSPIKGLLPGISTVLLTLTTAGYACADKLQENESQLQLKLHNYYQDRGPRDPGDSYIEKSSGRTVETQKEQQAWGQAAELNFGSQWFGVRHASGGLDASLYGGLKLVGQDDQYGTTVLKEAPLLFNSTQHQYRSAQSSYVKVGQLYVKGFAGEEGMKVNAKAGWHRIERPLMRTTSRMTPTTFQGVSLDAEAGPYDFYGSWYNRVSRHNHDRFEPLAIRTAGEENSRQQTIEHAYTLGGSFNHEKGLGSQLAYAESASYLKLYYASLNYLFKITPGTHLLLEGRYYKGQENGSHWKTPAKTYGGFDKDASLYNLNTRMTVDSISLKASFSQVEAEKQQSLGFFDYHLAYDGAHQYDSQDYWTKRQISDFNYNGEKVWQAGVAYAFDQLGVLGLTLGYTYTRGNDIKTNSPEYREKYKESEHNLELGYDFQQKELKGLGLKLQYAQHYADKEISEVKNQDKEGYRNEGASDLRIYIDYSITIF